MTQIDERSATAAATGANATKVFQDKARVGAGSSTERVAELATEVLGALHDIVRRHDVTYAEYDAVKAWLIRLGADGEWPLFLDVFVEHAVEETVNANRAGSKGTIEGPFYVAGAPQLPAEATLPKRDDEAGGPLLFAGQVRAVDGAALGGAQVEIWHADDLGFYSQFAPGLPEWNLRGTVIADDEGRFRIHTVLPAPYMIPGDGATGAFIAAAGWHTWRPAHLHFRVTAPGYDSLTTQLYFSGGDYLDSDVASAVKPELVLSPTTTDDGHEVTYDFELNPA